LSRPAYSSGNKILLVALSCLEVNGLPPKENGVLHRALAPKDSRQNGTGIKTQSFDRGLKPTWKKLPNKTLDRRLAILSPLQLLSRRLIRWLCVVR
jgi:hypothetical protein